MSFGGCEGKKMLITPTVIIMLFFADMYFLLGSFLFWDSQDAKKKRKNWNMRARFEVGNGCISHVTTDCFIVVNNKKGLALPANWSALFGVVFGGNTCSRNIPSFSAGPRIIIVCYK